MPTTRVFVIMAVLLLAGFAGRRGPRPGTGRWTGTAPGTPAPIPARRPFHALSQRTGAVLWRHHVTHGFREFSTPAIANGLVTFGTSRGQVIALDERTGAVVWWIRPSTREIVSAPAVTGDTLVILTEDGRVLARDALTGARRWTRRLPAEFLTSPAIANGVVYLADTQVSGSFWALALADGSTLLRRDDIHGFSAALSDPVIANGALYIGEWDGDSDTWLARYTL